MGVVMKQFIDRFKAMEKIANETLAANPEALVGVDSLPGSEHDAKVPESAKKPDEEVAQGQPAGATTEAGAVSGGDAKVLNENKLEMDQPLLNPEKKPLVTDDALTAKVANANLASLVGDLLEDIKAGRQKSAAQKSAAPAEPARQKVTLDDDTISKIAAAQATFMMGRAAAEKAVEKSASASPHALIKGACVKAAQEAGLSPEEAEAAASNVMAAAGVAPEAPAAPVAPVAAVPAEAPAAAAEGDAAAAEAAAEAIPDDVTEEELATAIVDLVSSGELDPNAAKALVEEIAGDDGDDGAPTEDQAAEIIANGIESGEITPEQAQEIAAALEGGEAAADAQGEADAEAQGAADAEAAIQDAKDEAQGAADAEEALKAAAAHVRSDAISKVASAVVARRGAEAAANAPGGRMLAKVASILQSRAAEKTASAQSGDASYIEGFKKKAAEMGVDPSALARYVCSNAK